MSYVIFGRAIKSEYLALGTLLGTGALVMASVKGGSSKKEAPGKSTLDKTRDAVPINASSKEEEEFIKNFIAEAEKESKH